jgi:hypothetical protein
MVIVTAISFPARFSKSISCRCQGGYVFTILEDVRQVNDSHQHFRAAQFEYVQYRYLDTNEVLLSECC